MRRMIVVFVMAAWMLMTVFAVPAVGDIEDPEGAGHKGGDDEPGEVYCDWYGPFEERPYDPWWEYWCWYGHPYYEWYFVLWTY